MLNVKVVREVLNSYQISSIVKDVLKKVRYANGVRETLCKYCANKRNKYKNNSNKKRPLTMYDLFTNTIIKNKLLKILPKFF